MQQTPLQTESPRTGEHLFPAWLRRFIPLLAVIGISLGTVGFLTGIREPGETPLPTLPPRIAYDAAPPAVSYAELPQANLRPELRAPQSLTQLVYERPGIFDPVVRTEEMKLAALADRARNRAYDGAPPTIPHPVETNTAMACLACHGEGLKIGERVASKISHAHLSNCTQCHVEASPGGLLLRDVTTLENDFVGLYRAGLGERANPGAPPTIPHHTWMREDCASCHGLVTRPGIRTTHPWLTNCMQCHALSARLDQTNFLEAPR